MKVGDILVCLIGVDDIVGGFTNGKHYRIFKVDKFLGGGEDCGWIKNDMNHAVHFRKSMATNENWEYLHVIRRNKLDKLKL